MEVDGLGVIQMLATSDLFQTILDSQILQNESTNLISWN